jgi:hypothetical protein
MPRLCAQGDILIERVADPTRASKLSTCVDDGYLTIAVGEQSGHCHRLFGTAQLFRDDNLAREIPPRLYLGHVQVKSPSARLEHDEHAPLILAQGTYRIRRQRELEPTEVGLYDADFDTRED